VGSQLLEPALVAMRRSKRRLHQWRQRACPNFHLRQIWCMPLLRRLPLQIRLEIIVHLPEELRVEVMLLQRESAGSVRLVFLKTRRARRWRLRAMMSTAVHSRSSGARKDEGGAGPEGSARM